VRSSWNELCGNYTRSPASNSFILLIGFGFGTELNVSGIHKYRWNGIPVFFKRLAV
jgi:hypothetical protein